MLFRSEVRRAKARKGPASEPEDDGGDAGGGTNGGGGGGVVPTVPLKG